MFWAEAGFLHNISKCTCLYASKQQIFTDCLKPTTSPAILLTVLPPHVQMFACATCSCTAITFIQMHSFLKCSRLFQALWVWGMCDFVRTMIRATSLHLTLDTWQEGKTLTCIYDWLYNLNTSTIPAPLPT